MKISFIAGSITLLAPAIAFAQPSQTEPPALMPAAPRAITPALDAFAQAGRGLQLKARWVRVDADILPTAFPAWKADGTSSHVATRDELRALDVVFATGAASITQQNIRATNNQIARLTFSPFTSFQLQQPFLPLPAPGPIDEMIVPRSAAPRIVMPNLAKPESRLPAMAPMPGMGSKFDLPLTAPLPAPRYYVVPQASPQASNFMDYKFELRPNFVGEEIALELRDSSQANSVPMRATVKAGETVVFSIPDVLMVLGNRKSRRTFLLITPVASPREERKLTR